jgi:long-chain acyl-CoA synthetase
VNANLALNLVASAARRPEATALRQGDAELSYALLDELSARLAAHLRGCGIRPGDRVAIMLPNVPQFPIAYYAALRAGAVVVPVNVLFKRREVAFHVSDSEARVLFAWPDFAEAACAGADDAGAECIFPAELGRLAAQSEPLAEVTARDPRDTAVILYTSGTTGTPKGAELTHDNLARNAQVSCGLFGLDERSVVLGALPLFHSFGQTCTLNSTIAAGGSLTLLQRFDAGRAIELIWRDRVTVFAGVPTMYSALLQQPERGDTSSLRLCVSGGAPLPLELLHEFERAFACPVIEGYGLSETSPVACFNHPDRERKPGSIGTPVEGVELKIVDELDRALGVGEVGEIAVRGHCVMKGYWRRPAETAAVISADGWFHTGDLGRVDADGYYFVVDRKKDMIIRGGFNVYPRELEEILYEHPAVREAAVIGVPHDELGEEVAAVVALRAGVAAPTEQELREFVKEQVAAYKYPRLVWFVDELPKTATGKILKREIRIPAVTA